MSTQKTLLAAAACGLAALSAACSPSSASTDASAFARADDASAGHARGCTTATIAGSYVVTCRGELLGGSAFLPMTLLGTAAGDAHGRFAGPATVSVGGTLVHQVVSGTATVNADCTGSIAYDVKIVTPQGEVTPPAPQDKLDLEFVVSAHGERLDGIVVDPGAAVLCELRRTHAP